MTTRSPLDAVFVTRSQNVLRKHLKWFFNLSSDHLDHLETRVEVMSAGAV